MSRRERGPPGRPRRPVTSRWFQLQGASAEAQAAPRRFAATIKLTPEILQRLQTAGSAIDMQLLVGAKDNDVQFVIDGEAHKLRCAKEDATKCDIYTSQVHEEGDSDGKAPLFDPYENLLFPLPELALSYKYYVPKQLNEDAKKSVALKSVEAEKLFRPGKAREGGLACPEPLVKISAAAAAALIGSQTAATAPPAKRAYTKRKGVPAADDQKAKKPRKPDPAAAAAALTTPNSHLLSPIAAHTPSSTAASPSASPGAASPSSSSLAQPKLMRSPSTAALPSTLTACEKLRARIVHFLAAQPLGLPMSTLRQRLGVAPEDMKSTLGVVAKYESPGYYNLRAEMYPEVQIEAWADYTAEDRRRVVQKMTRMGIDVAEHVRLKYGPTVEAHVKTGATAPGTITYHTPSAERPTTSSAASSAITHTPAAAPASPHQASSRNKVAADIVAPILAVAFPPLPDLATLPSEVPPSMLQTSHHGAPAVSAPPVVITEYMQYVVMHTDFLQKHRSYKMLGAWLKAIGDRTSDLLATLKAEGDHNVRSALKKQLVQFCSENIQLRQTVEAKQRVLHVVLRSVKQSLQAYAEENHHFTVACIKEEVMEEPPGTAMDVSH